MTNPLFIRIIGFNHGYWESTITANGDYKYAKVIKK